MVPVERELQTVLEKTNTAAERGLRTTSDKADTAADLEGDGIAMEEVADEVTMEETQLPP